MAELIHLEKTAPIRLLENRLEHLRKWLKDGDSEIAEAEQQIAECRSHAIEMADEIIAVEAALNALYAAQKTEDQSDG